MPSADPGTTHQKQGAPPWGWILDRLPRGSLRRRFAAGAFWAVAGAVARRGAVLIAAIVCGRVLGAAGFGRLGMIQATAGLFGSFAGLGLGLTASKFVAEFRRGDPGRAGRILGLSSAVAWAMGGALTILLLVLAPWLCGHVLVDASLTGPLMAGAGLVFFGAINGAQLGAFAGLEAFKSMAGFSAVAAAVSLPVTVAGVLLAGLNGAVWGLVLSLAVACVIFGVGLRRECAGQGLSYRWRGSWAERHVLWRFSFPAFAASAVTTPALWGCYALLVRQPDGYLQLGLFTAAQRFAGAVIFAPALATTAMLPILSQLAGAGDHGGFRRLLRGAMLSNGGLAIAGGAVLAALAPWWVRLYGAAYAAAAPVLMILAIWVPCQVAAITLGQALLAAGRAWTRCGVDVMLACVLVGLSAALLPQHGAAGLAAACAASFALAAGGLGLILRGKVRNLGSRTPPAVASIEGKI